MKNFLLQFAQTIKTTDVPGLPTLTESDVVTNTLNIAYFLTGIIAVVVIIIGAIMYVTSAGNSGSVTKAKSMILYSVVGIFIILGAYAITNFVIGKF